MTREEAKLSKIEMRMFKIGLRQITAEQIADDINDQIDTIYDDFESRICANCKNIYIPKQSAFKAQCLFGYSNGSQDLRSVVDLTFGCNTFERKEA